MSRNWKEPRKRKKLRRVGKRGFSVVHVKVALAYLGAATEIVSIVNRAVLEVRQALDDGADTIGKARKEIKADDFMDFFDGTNVFNPDSE